MFGNDCNYLSSFCPFVILLPGLKDTHTHAQSAPNNTKPPNQLNSPSFFVVRNYGLFPLYPFWFTLVQSKRTSTICTAKYINSSCYVLFTLTGEKWHDRAGGDFANGPFFGGSAYVHAVFGGSCANRQLGLTSTFPKFCRPLRKN